MCRGTNTQQSRFLLTSLIKQSNCVWWNEHPKTFDYKTVVWSTYTEYIRWLSISLTIDCIALYYMLTWTPPTNTWEYPRTGVFSTEDFLDHALLCIITGVKVTVGIAVDLNCGLIHQTLISIITWQVFTRIWRERILVHTRVWLPTHPISFFQYPSAG